MLLGIRKPRAGSSQLREVRGHAGAAPLQIAAHHLVEILIFDRRIRQLTRLEDVIEILLGGVPEPTQMAWPESCSSDVTPLPA